MELYRELYFHLFNAVTDAIAQLDALNYGAAREILTNAQIEAEDRFLNAEEDT